MSELSKNTKDLIYRLYNPSREALEICDMLELECGTDVLSCEDWTPEQLERIRFAVLKLDIEKKVDLESAIELAQTDWRDLLMSAGFGEDIEAHKVWAKCVSY